MTATQVRAGLDGVVAAETRLSGVDGQAGELIIAGFAVEELAPQAIFEEVVYLLWHDALPTAAQLSGFTASPGASRGRCRRSRWRSCKRRQPRKTSPMDALRMAADTLSLDTGQADLSENDRTAIRS